MSSNIKCGLYYTQEYISLDGENVRVFMQDGRRKDMFECEESMEKLLHAHQANLFVGWTPGGDKLHVSQCFQSNTVKLQIHVLYIPNLFICDIDTFLDM